MNSTLWKALSSLLVVALIAVTGFAQHIFLGQPKHTLPQVSTTWFVSGIRSNLPSSSWTFMESKMESRIHELECSETMPCS